MDKIIVGMIYHHAERSITGHLTDYLRDNNCDVRLAPLGFEVGSKEWMDQVRANLEQSDVTLIFMTPRAVDDEWFEWRLQLITHVLAKPFIPIMAEPVEMPALLLMYQYIDMCYPSHQQHILHQIQDIAERNKENIQKTNSYSLFVSYSSSDSDTVIRLVTDLRKKNLRVWRDKDNIPKGASWDNEIQKALTDCTHVLFMATPRSVASENVLDEIGFALNKGKIVIPIMLEICDLPLRVHRAQWIDFRKSYDSGLKALLDYLGIN